uniref:VGF nerve growth factor inducible n=1 Tax=Iconisemion striatum TaxID=60296 RepID=A0A1A7Y0B8_9TELE
MAAVEVSASSKKMRKRKLEGLVECSDPGNSESPVMVKKKKKKKKDMLPEIVSPLHSSPSSFLSAWQMLNNKNSFSVSKQPSPTKDLTWFQETKPDGFQTKSSKSSLANQSFLPKSEKLFKQDRWFKSPKSLWSAYPYRSYTYPPYYHRKPYLDHYPFFIPPLPRPKFYYYIPKPALSLNNFPGTSINDLSTFSPKRRYRSRVQLQSPHSHLQQKSYFTRYHSPIYPQQFQQDFIPKVKPPSQTVSSPSQLYTAGLGPAGTKKQNYLETGKSDRIIHGDLEKYIQQTLMNRQQIQD